MEWQLSASYHSPNLDGEAFHQREMRPNLAYLTSYPNSKMPHRSELNAVNGNSVKDNFVQLQFP